MNEYTKKFYEQFQNQKIYFKRDKNISNCFVGKIVYIEKYELFDNEKRAYRFLSLWSYEKNELINLAFIAKDFNSKNALKSLHVNNFVFIAANKMLESFYLKEMHKEVYEIEKIVIEDSI